MAVDLGQVRSHIRIAPYGWFALRASVIGLVAIFLAWVAAQQDLAVCGAVLLTAVVILLGLVFFSITRYRSVTVYDQGLIIHKRMSEDVLRWQDVEAYQVNLEHSTRQVSRTLYVGKLFFMPIPLGEKREDRFFSGYRFHLQDGRIVSVEGGAELFPLRALIQEPLNQHVIPRVKARFAAGERIQLHPHIEYSLDGISGARLKGTGRRTRREPSKLPWDQIRELSVVEGTFSIIGPERQRIVSAPVGELINLAAFRTIAQQQRGGDLGEDY